MRGKVVVPVICMLVLLSLPSALSTGEAYTPNPASDYLIYGYERMPFKDQRGDEAWSTNINANYSPDRVWDTDFSNNGDLDISYKCLSYATSSVNDWFNIQHGMSTDSYKSVLHGVQESGTNPRLLEATYHTRVSALSLTYRYTPAYASLVAVDKCPITNESIPYRLRGYADILQDPPEWFSESDPLLDTPKEYKYTTIRDRFNIGKFKEIPISFEAFRDTDDENNLKDAMRKYGAILSYTENPGSSINIHSMALVGYGSDGSGTFFIAHDNYGAGGSGSFSEYKKLRIADIDSAYAFLPNTEWPFIYHDLRRTGYTMLKGDMTSSGAINGFTTNLQSGVTSEEMSYISIGNIDNEDVFSLLGENEIVVTTNNGSFNQGGKVYAVHFNSFTNNYVTDWTHNIPVDYVRGAPSIENFDSTDNDKEIIFGLRNGTMIAIDGDTNNTIWTCSVAEKHSDFAGVDARGRLANYAIADLDLDGTNEIIFTDSQSTSLYDWPGEVYVVSQYVGKKVSIEHVEEYEGKYGYFVKAETIVLDNVQMGTETVELRASRVFGLHTDAEGNVGWGKETKLGQYLKKMKAEHYRDLVGKEVVVQTMTNKEGQDFLTFN